MKFKAEDFFIILTIAAVIFTTGLIAGQRTDCNLEYGTVELTNYTGGLEGLGDLAPNFLGLMFAAILILILINSMSFFYVNRGKGEASGALKEDK